MKTAVLAQGPTVPAGRMLKGVAFLVASAFAMSVSASAQHAFPLQNSSPGKLLFCSPEEIAAVKQLSFRQRTCWYASELVSPWAALRAAAGIGIANWEGTDNFKHHDEEGSAERFRDYYVRRSARETGELLAGYLNREDPRPHASGETGFRKRFRSAFLSVLITKNNEGSRPAVGPLVGSFASSFAGAAVSREHSGADFALRGAGITYSSYFGNALYTEFQPDISSLVHRMLHHKQN